jgi:hypothetical protein
MRGSVQLELSRRSAAAPGKLRILEKEMGRIEAVVTENLTHLCGEWRRIHGVS